MAELLYLSRADVERLLDVDAMFDALARALIAYSDGSASAPPRSAVRVKHGLLGVMQAYVPGVALETKLVSVFPENDRLGIPSHQGLIALFDVENGTPVAVMDGGYITQIRTGGTAAVAARLLAREDASVLAILGAGAQGWSHLETFPRIRDFKEIRVASRNDERARDLAAHHPKARATATFEEAVRGADVVACCTDAREPIISLDWLKPGVHVSAIGGTFGPELDAETVNASRIFVEWRGAVTNPPPAGAHELQGIDPSLVTEIGEVLAGTNPGRQSAEEMTLYKSTGIAVEDAATAALVYERALREGAGTRLPL